MALCPLAQARTRWILPGGRRIGVYGRIFGMHATQHPDLAPLFERLARAPAVLVSVFRTQGSVPREAGTWMAVWPDGQIGTIGGGHLEWDALKQARDALAAGASAPWTHRVALGPSLGQCCGGAISPRRMINGKNNGRYRRTGRVHQWNKGTDR